MTQAALTLATRPRRRRRRILIALAVLLVVVIGVNAIAYMQARAMTHFVDGGDRTAPPEAMGIARKIGVLFIGVRIPRPVNLVNPADVGLEYQTVRFGGTAGADCEGWYVPTANPTGLCIAFHAYTSSKSSLLGAATAFREMGWDVMLVDFRGSGGSVGDRTTMGFDEANDVAAAVDFAAHRWPGRTVVLYGQSMGGAAILRAVADLGVNPSAVIIESTFDRLLSTAQNRFHAMGLPALGLSQLLVFWGGEQVGFNGFKHNPADYATRVHCPVLMMQGSQDPRVTDDQARNLFDHLAGPRQFELFPDCGHCEFLSKDSVRWTATVSTFLAEWATPKVAR